MKPRIIIVFEGFHFSGSSTQRILGYAKGFKDNGYDVIMIVSLHSDLPTNYHGIKFIVVEEENRKHSLVTANRFVKAVRNEARIGDIIFSYGIPLYGFFFPYKRCHVFAEITEIPFCGKKPTFSQYIANQIRFRVARFFSGIIVISVGLKQYYQRHGVKNVQVVNMFVDSSRFDGLVKDKKESYIAYCGTVSLRKDGVDILIKAFSKFVKYIQNYKLLIIGLFENDQMEYAIKALIRDLELEEKVICTGSMLPEDLANCLKNAEILALARQNNRQAKYGFPTKLGEYLCTGNPIVVTKVGEIPNYLIHNVNAIVAEPDNIEDFADKLIWVASHYDEAKQIAKVGQSLVDKEFSSKVQSLKAIEFMEKTINNNRYQ